MKNVDISLSNDSLLIKINLTEEIGESSTGKSMLVASTEGAVPLASYVSGSEDIKKMKINLSLFKSKE